MRGEGSPMGPEEPTGAEEAMHWVPRPGEFFMREPLSSILDAPDALRLVTQNLQGVYGAQVSKKVFRDKKGEHTVIVGQSENFYGDLSSVKMFVSHSPRDMYEVRPGDTAEGKEEINLSLVAGQDGDVLRYVGYVLKHGEDRVLRTEKPPFVLADSAQRRGLEDAGPLKIQSAIANHALIQQLGINTHAVGIAEIANLEEFIVSGSVPGRNR